MTIEWTTSMLAKKSDQDIENISENCQNVGRSDIVELCKAELLARKINPIKVRHTKNSSRNITQTKKLKDQAVDKLLDLANELQKEYDLSKSRARSLSKETRNFSPHGFLSSNGNPKVGRAKRGGLVAFERHISYRLGDKVYELMVVQVDISESVKYQIMSPECFLSNPSPLSDLRPYLTPLGESTLLRYGESFSTFEEAAEKFKQIMEDDAPKRIQK